MKFIEDSMELDEKGVYSHGVFNLLAILFVSLTGVMEALCVILYFVKADMGLQTYLFLFYPTLICLILALFYSIPEILRNTYMSSMIVLIVAGILSLLLITSIILQGVLLGKVYIIPFILI